MTIAIDHFSKKHSLFLVAPRSTRLQGATEFGAGSEYTTPGMNIINIMGTRTNTLRPLSPRDACGGILIQALAAMNRFVYGKPVPSNPGWLYAYAYLRLMETHSKREDTP